MMRTLCFTILIAFLSPLVCAAEDKKDAVWTEKCPNCGTVFQISRSFDQADYDFFGQLVDELPSVTSIFYRSPHGPTPACSSTWSKDLPYERLRDKMAPLRRDTYDSFLARNRYIAEHAKDTFTTPAGHKIQIIRETKPDVWPLELSRVGFSTDGQQALIYEGAGVYVYEKSGARWKRVDGMVLWMP